MNVTESVLSKELRLKGAIQEWRAAKIALEDAQKREEALREEILALVDHQDYVGNGVVITAYIRKGAVDYSAVPQLQGVDLDRFRKEPTISYKIVASLRE